MINFEYFDNNFFAKRLYPDGVDTPIIISSVLASYRKNTEFNFIVYQKPSIEVNKWGYWGVDYNSLYFETSTNSSPIKLEINNMKDIGVQKFNIDRNHEGNIEIVQLSRPGNLFLVIDGLIIQNIVPLKDN